MKVLHRGLGNSGFDVEVLGKSSGTDFGSWHGMSLAVMSVGWAATCCNTCCWIVSLPALQSYGRTALKKSRNYNLSIPMTATYNITCVLTLLGLTYVHRCKQTIHVQNDWQVDAIDGISLKVSAPGALGREAMKATSILQKEVGDAARCDSAFLLEVWSVNTSRLWLRCDDVCQILSEWFRITFQLALKAVSRAAYCRLSELLSGGAAAAGRAGGDLEDNWLGSHFSDCFL